MAGDRRLEVGVAVIGVVGALTGALIGGAVTYLTARQAIGEERSVEVRVQRTTAYTALVATAEQVRRESEALAERCRVARERNERPYSADDTPEDEVFADIECIFEFGEKMRGAQDAHSRAAADVFLYGSDAANTAAEALSATVRFVGISTVDFPAYADARDAFLRVMCRELSPDPRGGCS